jgi:signal peptidase I
MEIRMTDAKDKMAISLPEGTAKGALRDNLEVVCFAILLIMFFKTFVGQQFVIPSASMRETLKIGDHLLTNKFVFATPQWDWETKLFPMRKVERGDIIVFRYPLDRDKDFVKRCVALPGDTVQMKHKRLFINGQQVTGTFEHHFGDMPEIGPKPGPWPPSRDAGPVQVLPESLNIPTEWPYADPAVQAMDQQGQEALPGGFRDELGPVRVPEGFLLAMGDNRDYSSDGRFWGFLPMDHLRGRPFLIWWSFREGGNDDTNAITAQGPADIFLNFFDGARHFFTWTRWDRTGTIPH